MIGKHKKKIKEKNGRWIATCRCGLVRYEHDKWGYVSALITAHVSDENNLASHRKRRKEETKNIAKKRIAEEKEKKRNGK